MADPGKRFDDNLDGKFFVDQTCINCDTCRQLAPQTFGEQAEHSFVYYQPSEPNAERAATQALLCCPTGSIGTVGGNDAKAVMADLPLPLTANIYYCGFNSPKSYGGNSYFIQHESGSNWLIDSPKFLPHLVKQFRALGGIKYIFLTHRDDVADAKKYATEFSAMRIVHAADADSAPGSEIIIDLKEPRKVNNQLHRSFADLIDFTIIPTPGHTRGHMVLLYNGKYLFTGDHLAFDRESQRLEAFREHCWYSWQVQAESMEKLNQHSFEWLFTGHGERVFLPAKTMHAQIQDLVMRMQS